MADIEKLLALSSARHSHLCPRQVLGVRMGLAGGKRLGVSLPREDKLLLVIAETDGCFIDGLEVSTGISVGRRTLRVQDYGKIAATFVNVKTGEALRLAPWLDVRQRALEYAPEEKRHYFAQLAGYQHMPDHLLFSITPVLLTPSIEQIISRAGIRVNCSICGEEILNEREIIQDGLAYCRACFGQSYYQIRSEAVVVHEAAAVREPIRVR